VRLDMKRMVETYMGALQLNSRVDTRVVHDGSVH
jgi:hypothetical protein